ncbi:MAG: dTMP kinase [Gammaproteobacteria bacterium CG_4_10_14_0_8_um_filter_38_16]|nr:MAG: dTMP kinase [Gammaproteobacteria bacterium CG_4_10_14_0_8_um_filter_38_16]PJA03616.1 MAG: dTMP kinase [Gammaproteobacteria bacterium CG_4_10_14_0_2_um_filter_38_22]PJB10438.1 MAG: dTMP kinase [Gammaproteobacteria bacterium CG_4_9_14_3_um_filter_38_9]
MKNNFITLEGGEGVGKSTAMAFIKKYFADKNKTCVFTREPGGTKTGEKIRDILLTNDEEVIYPETELLLMFAARAQHIEQIIKPALAAGKTVISDRFTDASFAYQGGGRGVAINHIATLSDLVQGDLQPNLTLLFDAPVEVGLNRMNHRGAKDRIEQEPTAFFKRVQKAYLDRAAAFPKRFVIIDANQAVDQVQKQIKNALDEKIK